MPINPRRLLYEDDYLLAVDKLSCELVVRGKGAVQKLPLFDFLKKDYPALRSLHRLDFETSGVVLFAKGKKIADSIIDSKFAGWEKLYRTLVMGRVPKKEGIIAKKLEARGKGKVDALTKYKRLELYANSSYIEADIATGRYHQIRKHFAAINHPLVLDYEYGYLKFNSVFKQEFGFSNFFLHANSLELIHPVTKEKLYIEAPLPKSFELVLKSLRSLS